MRTSDSITELATALAIAQGQFKPLLKTGTNPHLNSKYADLAGVRDSVIESLSVNSLSYVQAIEAASDARSLLCITRLMHKSGEWIESELALPVGASEKQNYIQQAGSAITYLRRYTLSALLGVAADDDDDGSTAKGAAPSHAACPKAQTTPAPQQANPQASAEPLAGQCPSCNAPNGKPHGKGCQVTTWEKPADTIGQSIRYFKDRATSMGCDVQTDAAVKAVFIEFDDRDDTEKRPTMADWRRVADRIVHLKQYNVEVAGQVGAPLGGQAEEVDPFAEPE
jgi:hypothetical protein